MARASGALGVLGLIVVSAACASAPSLPAERFEHPGGVIVGDRIPASWAQVEDERSRFGREVSPPPGVSPFPSQGTLLVASTRETPAYTMEAYLDEISTHDPPREVPHLPVRVHNLVVRRRPVAQLAADGTITVHTETDRDLAGGRVDYGVRLRGFAPPDAIYRKTAPVRIDADAVEARIDLRSLLTPKYDVDRVRARGRGVIALRLRLLDAGRNVERSEDLELPFRCAEVPCGARTPLVQLPAVRLGPFVDRVGPRSATISFETDVPTTARVVVRDEVGVRGRFDAPKSSLRHEIDLTDLRPSKEYRYWVFVQDGRGESHERTEGALRTAPVDGARFTFAVLSDSRSGLGDPDSSYRGSNRRALTDLSRLIALRRAELVVFVGDLINGYTTEPGAYRHELEGFLSSVQPVASRIPFYEAMGNHEALIEAWSSGFMNDRPGPINSQSIFREVVVNPLGAPPPEGPDAPRYDETVYGFDYGTAHFSVVNTNYWYRSHHERTDHPRFGQGVREGYLTDAQLAWLDRDLAGARARGQRHLFVFTHEPAFPAAGHVDDAMYWNGRFPEVLRRRDDFWSMLSRHGVVAAFFGDEHSYTRALIDASVDPRFEQPVWQLVTGGAGAPYYALDESVPWAHAVRAFRPDHHFCEVDVDAEQVVLRVVNRMGRVIDEAVLRD